MAVWDKQISSSFMFLLAGAVAQRVDYQDPGCAVKGSTVTLLCTFTPIPSFMLGEEEVLTEITRVIWCRNHELCQGSTPAVYDSELTSNNPRYRYLGDKKSNCSLRISDIQKEDGGTLRFRMEANSVVAHFTGRRGVVVTVTDGSPMVIHSSVNETQMREGQSVNLSCTTRCTFHQLKVTWFRDGHALSQSGPTLQIAALTAEDSGNYICGVKSNNGTLSQPYRLYVEAEEAEGTNTATGNPLLAVRLVLFTLHSVLIIIVASILIKRMCVCTKGGLRNMTVLPPDVMEEL